MVRKVFFSFHYERDIWRVMQVRNSWVVPNERTGQRLYTDAAELEEAKRKAGGTEKWIEQQLEGTSVTVVLIGAETARRPWVIHEIKRSHQLRKGLLGVRIHGVQNQKWQTDVMGLNPFDQLYIDEGGRKKLLGEVYPTYDWQLEHGRTNLAKWIEAAAKAAGR